MGGARRLRLVVVWATVGVVHRVAFERSGLVEAAENVTMQVLDTYADSWMKWFGFVISLKDSLGFCRRGKIRIGFTIDILSKFYFTTIAKVIETAKYFYTSL